jgi:hypothetical protein
MPLRTAHSDSVVWVRLVSSYGVNWCGGHAPDNNEEKEGTRLRYSFGQRLEESGKPWRDAKLAACKTERIFELENQLSQHNSHTSSLGKF